MAQKSRKRDTAGKVSGGDTDLPYKEKWRERQERLADEAKRRAEKTGTNPRSGKELPLEEIGGSNEDGSEMEVTNAQRREAADEDDDDEVYYDLVSRQAKDKKAARASAAASKAIGETSAAMPDESAVGPDGKRAITYAIQKNKGLTPHRKKEVRNPRVKKRLRFEEKQKKLRSVRAVYKGEREGRGGYGGEKTGINRGLVKSIKLS